MKTTCPQCSKLPETSRKRSGIQKPGKNFTIEIPFKNPEVNYYQEFKQQYLMRERKCISALSDNRHGVQLPGATVENIVVSNSATIIIIIILIVQL